MNDTPTAAALVIAAFVPAGADPGDDMLGDTDGCVEYLWHRDQIDLYNVESLPDGDVLDG